MLIRKCSCCSQDSAGNHDLNCPNHSDNQVRTESSTGWTCPICKKVHSPMITECDCSKVLKEDTKHVLHG